MAGYVYKQRIGGEWRDAADGRVANVVNPATEEVVATVPFGGAADCRARDRCRRSARFRHGRDARRTSAARS